jgi:hypothetical protein
LTIRNVPKVVWKTMSDTIQRNPLGWWKGTQ